MTGQSEFSQRHDLAQFWGWFGARAHLFLVNLGILRLRWTQNHQIKPGFWWTNQMTRAFWTGETLS